jgi:hypothetical protein
MATSTRQQVMKQIAELRRKMDPDVLDSAERMARAHLGLPSKPSEAVRLFLQAKANGGRNRAEVLAEVERRVQQRKTRH